MQKALSLALTLALALGLLSGCGGAPQGNPAPQSAPPATAQALAGKIKVTATIGMVADVVQIVGGNHVEVTTLMGPGVDPHLFKASEGDIGKLSQAQIIFYSGLNLEGKMGDILVKMARRIPTVPVSEKIPEDMLLEPADQPGHWDPHVWMDVSLWMKATEAIRDALVELDPARRTDYDANANQYLGKLADLHKYAREQFATIARAQRVLVTAHDAFSYMARAYDFDVEGLQGISTAAEYGLADVQRLVDSLAERKIKAVFVESSIPKKSIEAVVAGARAKGHAVAIGGELFSDAMGNPGTPEGTYLGMIRHNVDTIVNGLS